MAEENSSSRMTNKSLNEDQAPAGALDSVILQVILYYNVWITWSVWQIIQRNPICQGVIAIVGLSCIYLTYRISVSLIVTQLFTGSKGWNKILAPRGRYSLIVEVLLMEIILYLGDKFKFAHCEFIALTIHCLWLLYMTALTLVKNGRTLIRTMLCLTVFSSICLLMGELYSSQGSTLIGIVFFFTDLRRLGKVCTIINCECRTCEDSQDVLPK